MNDLSRSRPDRSIEIPQESCGLSGRREPQDCGVQRLPQDCGVQRLPQDCGVQRLPQACGVQRSPRECGDLPFLIKRDASWLYRGSPIGRKELVCLFASVLTRAADGAFWLETPAERGRIEVEDAPFLAVELDWSGFGRDQVLNFRTNVDQIVTAGPAHPIRVAHDLLTCEPTPYLMVRAGLGRHPIEARISRAVYYELVALAEPEMVMGRRMLGVWSQRQFFALGEMPTGEEACAR